MPKSFFKKNNTCRRYLKTDDIRLNGWIIMRFYGRYSSEDFFYVIFNISDFCEKYHRFDRDYDFNFLSAEIMKLFRKADKLNEQILVERTKNLETEIKNLRLQKQRRLLIKKLRELNDREAQNIIKLKKNKARERTDASTVATSEPTRINSSFVFGEWNPSFLLRELESPGTAQLGFVNKIVGLNAGIF